MSEGRMTHAKYEGRDYEIPEIWLMGITTNQHLSIPEAVAWWAYQEELREIEESHA